MNIVYIHIGSELVSYIVDSVYQTILINKYSVKIYVILSDNLIVKFNKIINSLNLDTLYDIPYFQNLITVIPLSILEMSLMNEASNAYIEYKTFINRYSLEKFRDSFWISTTCRFFYIKEFVKLFLKGHKNIIHIENDIMLYKKLDELNLEYNKGHIYMVKDAENRVVPSFLCFCDLESLEILTQFITSVHKKSNTFVNDMEILARFPKLIKLPYEPYEQSNIIYDGACIGQYIGGIDPRNIGAPNTNDCIEAFNNPSKGFINRECSFNISENSIYKVIGKNSLLKYLLENNNKSKKEIVNLHIHSKQLCQFSSIFDLQYNDIITGDRVCDLCSYIVITKDIENFHKSLESKATRIYLDSQNINIPLTTCKIFVYTHLLDAFITVLEQLSLQIQNNEQLHKQLKENQIKYTIYTHNSDHEFTEEHYQKFKKITEETNILFQFYAQNVNCNVYNNVSLLPIGIANKMWPHGSVLDLYKRMSTAYNKTKTKTLYINLNTSTYPYRKEILNEILKEKSIIISENKDYKNYIEELSEHCFSLCVRGNGIDTHRFWESLYLGTIPVIINNKHTNCNNFVQYLKDLKLVFYEITEDDTTNIIKSLKTITRNLYKTLNLYKTMLDKCDSKLFCNNSLKIENYK